MNLHPLRMGASGLGAAGQRSALCRSRSRRAARSNWRIDAPWAGGNRQRNTHRRGRQDVTAARAKADRPFHTSDARNHANKSMPNKKTHPGSKSGDGF
jgi:hypothetical protein